MRTGLTPLLLLALACSGEVTDSAAPEATAPGWSVLGAHGAGTVSRTLAVGDRTIPLQLWYPSAAATVPSTLSELVADDADRATLSALLAAAPEGCPALQHDAEPDAVPVAGPAAPVVLLSHCHGCLGISNATIGATLARYGFIAVAPDHVGNTLFDALEGDAGPIDEATLARRAEDLSAALDATLAGGLLPGGLEADPDRVGVLGHSFGAVTAARTLETDPRVTSALAIGAPIDNPLLQGAAVEGLDAPVMLVLLEEDNSIQQLGNDLMVRNFESLPGPAWLVAVPDAGHWSVSDLCGATPEFLPGCGEDTRQTDGTAFSYPSPDQGRATAGALAAAFFAHTLTDDATAARWLAAPQTALPVTVETR